jgi:tetratricopeptide (TPR) repeat protein
VWIFVRGETQKPSPISHGRPDVSARRDRTVLYHAIVLFVVSFALYARTLAYGFVSDDDQEVLQDHLIRSLANIPSLFAHSVWFFEGGLGDRYYRPLKLTAYAVEYSVFGFHAAWWHLFNLVLNAGIVVAIYFLIRSLVSDGNGLPGESRRAPQLAFWSALLFAFHPVHVEAVAWIAAGNDLLCGLALAISLWFYHRARQGIRPTIAYAASAFFFLAALFSHETALTFPAVILAYDFFYRQESPGEMARAWRRYSIYVAALAIYLVARERALGGFAPSGKNIPLVQMIWSVPVFACRYLWKEVVPTGLNYWYSYGLTKTVGWKPLLAMAVMITVVAAPFWLRRRQPVLSLGLAWFWLTLLPSLDLRKVSLFFTDRYLYIPSMGLAVFGGWAWLWLRDRATRPALRPVAYACLAALLGFYSFVLLRRLPVWQDDLRLWTITAEQSPRSAYPLGQAGSAYLKIGNPGRAIVFLRRAIQIQPDLAYAHDDLGSAYSALGQQDAAMREVKLAIRLQPDFPAYWTNLAILYQVKKNWPQAAQACQRGLSLDPNDHSLLNTLGVSLWNEGHPRQAEATYRRAIAADPTNADSYINLANALAQQHQINTAIAELLSAERAAPNSPNTYLVHFELGVMYEGESQWRPAALEYQKTLQLKPNFPYARAKLQPLMPFLTNPNLNFKTTPLVPVKP